MSDRPEAAAALLDATAAAMLHGQANRWDIPADHPDAAVMLRAEALSVADDALNRLNAAGFDVVRSEWFRPHPKAGKK